MDRIIEIGRFDHVVLLVAAQAMLWTKGSRQPDVRAGGKRIEAVHQRFCHRCRVGEEGDAPASQRRTQTGVRKEPVYAERHATAGEGKCAAKQSE